MGYFPFGYIGILALVFDSTSQSSLSVALLLTCITDARKGFAQALTNFIPFLSQTSIQIANRLEIYQKEHDLNDKSVSGANSDTNGNAGLEVAALQLDAVIDLPVINTRPGLYIFLNALVHRASVGVDWIADSNSLLRVL